MNGQFFAVAMPTCDSGPTARYGRADSGPTVVMRRVPSIDSGPTLRRRPAGTIPPACADAVLEARLLAILDLPLAAIETPTQGFDRKERALGNAFAELTAAEASGLLARFDINYTCDALARKFNKLTTERRDRLFGFLRLLCD